MEKYDLRNEDVEETLSRRYRYKSDDKEHEYICQTCHWNLKAGCMPAQAVANQLEVPVVPVVPDILQNLTRLEGRCIALRIPFMSIRPMRKGGLGKITGPCINVPASLEPITEVLPRIPEETKLVVVKLKRMLMYKSHYLCDYIRPEIVMNALRWLKVNNPHYENVKIDDQWPDKLEHDRLYKTINGQDDSENSDEDYLDEEEDTDLKDGYCEDRNMNDEVDGEACESEESDSEDEKTDEELEEANLKEDQLELDRMATVTVEGPSTCIQIYDLEEAVFSIAPGQNSIPKFILMDEDFEHLAFPNYFPCGVGGYDVLEPRKVKLDLRRYINQRLLNVKGHFSQDMDYIFALQYATELQQLKSEMKIALKKTTGRTPVGHINAGNMKNFDFINNLVKHDYAYKFMNNVRGTPAYWQQRLLDTLAMMQKFSTPYPQPTGCTTHHLTTLIHPQSYNMHTLKGPPAPIPQPTGSTTHHLPTLIHPQSYNTHKLKGPPPPYPQPTGSTTHHLTTLIHLQSYNTHTLKGPTAPHPLSPTHRKYHPPSYNTHTLKGPLPPTPYPQPTGSTTHHLTTLIHLQSYNTHTLKGPTAPHPPIPNPQEVPPTILQQSYTKGTPHPLPPTHRKYHPPSYNTHTLKGPCPPPPTPNPQEVPPTILQHSYTHHLTTLIH